MALKQLSRFPGWILAFTLSPLLLFEIALLVGPTVSFTTKLTLHDQQRIQQIVLLCVLAIGGLSIWRAVLTAISLRIPGWVKFLWVLGLGLGLISSALSEFPRYAGLEWALIFLLACSALLLGGQSLLGGANFDQWATRVIVLIVIFISAKAMLYYWAALSQNALDTTQLFGLSFSNRRFFGQAASMLLPILAFPITQDRKPWLKTGSGFFLLTILWMLAIASGTRGTWLAMLIAALTLALFSWRASLPWIRVQGAACIAGLALFAIFFLWLPDGAAVESRVQDLAALSGREIIWGIAWEQILQHPWLGIGPMHLAAIRNPVATHPHNALLQLGAEWGLLATLAFITPLIIAIFALLVKLHKLQNNAKTPLMVCLSGSLVAAVTHSMVDGVVVMPYSQVLLVFVCGWALGLYYREQNEHKEALNPTGIGFVNLFVPIFALGLIFFGILPEILDRVAITEQLMSDKATPIRPRFWVQGWIP